MKKLITTLACSLSLMLSTNASAANVEINWENPKEYTDVRAANESRKRFRDRTLKALEEYIAEEAEKRLPADQLLKMKVTDVDLAGQVWPASFVGFGNGVSDVRLIKRLYIPRMEFEYELLDAEGAQIKTAEVDLKDLAFQDRANTFFRSESLRYEKNMLRHWFRDEFPELVAKN